MSKTIKIAVPIKPKDFKEGIKLMKHAKNAGADIIEIWTDALQPEIVQELLNQKPVPIILKSSNPEQFANTSADYIDIPFTDALTEQKYSSQVILSYHDFASTPDLDQLKSISSKMFKLNPAIIKIATFINGEDDLINLYRYQMDTPELAGKRVIIGMGEKGQISRVLSVMFENAFTFACIDDDHKTADGQPTVAELRAQWEKLNFK